MTTANSTDFPPIPADIAATTAPLLFGTLFNWALYGVLSIQTYIYYLHFPDDKIGNKILVYTCYIIEVVQTAMTSADLYFWFATGYGNVTHLGNVNISPVDTPVLCGIIAAIVQCFFAYRIFTLRRSYLWICVLIIVTSVVQTVGALATAFRSFKLQEYARFHENVIFPQALDVWYIGDTICDILIAGTMLWLLHTSQKQEGINHARQIFAKLVRLVVETNTLTASMALISFICYITLPKGNVFICTTLVMGKLYSNTLLMTFNNRIALRNMQKQHATIDGTGRIRQHTDVNITVDTFRAFDTFPDPQLESESYEIDARKDKVHELTAVVTAV
ncbi:hypothetical protein HYPSUDRAFT_39549 [Hypholoma sublateritium FD-334 SS-4]|uniref:DUF6534 domain-containing protein n=1 Tax=Hypholoma sublateritium (strain FD-334 SS-4) TaxID=945553 RepID=A0A0D2MJ87_HYPSF|nr:hypothetical protein HYPSUDRAFT_39549 [Hypholoma sublateritium FD-334 SS-4]